MNKQRLLELAGVSSNMSNPSFEPETDVRDNKIEGPAETDIGDAGESDTTIDRIREEARKGVDSPEDASRCCEVILNLIDEEDVDREDVAGEDFDREEI